MKTIEKEQIRTKLAEFCEIKGGQNKAANSMRGVSPATISQVLNNNWDLISEEMWRTIASQIGYDPRAWVVVETRGYKRMYGLLQDAQDNSLVFAVTGDAVRARRLRVMPQATATCITSRVPNTGTASTLWRNSCNVWGLIRRAAPFRKGCRILFSPSKIKKRRSWYSMKPTS